MIVSCLMIEFFPFVQVNAIHFPTTTKQIYCLQYEIGMKEIRRMCYFQTTQLEKLACWMLAHYVLQCCCELYYALCVVLNISFFPLLMIDKRLVSLITLHMTYAMNKRMKNTKIRATEEYTTNTHTLNVRNTSKKKKKSLIMIEVTYYWQHFSVWRSWFCSLEACLCWSGSVTCILTDLNFDLWCFVFLLDNIFGCNGF